MKRLVIVSLALAAVAAASAANPKDPIKRHTAADTRIANLIALKRADLASGFKQVKSSNSGGSTCSAQPDESNLIETADVDPTFDARGGAIEIDSQVQMFATAAQARRDWAVSTLAAVRACATETTAKQFGKNAKVHVFVTTPPATAKAERTKAFHLTIDATVNGQRVLADSYLIALGKGRTDAILTSFALKGMLRPAALNPLVAILARRLDAVHS